MARTVKIFKNDKNEDVEVYVDNCAVCNVEMAFPKAAVDHFEKIVPFIKNKIESGSPCVDCALKLEKENKPIFTQEEYEQIKNALIANQNDTE